MLESKGSSAAGGHDLDRIAAADAGGSGHARFPRIRTAGFSTHYSDPGAESQTAALPLGVPSRRPDAQRKRALLAFCLRTPAALAILREPPTRGDAMPLTLPNAP